MNIFTERIIYLLDTYNCNNNNKALIIIIII